MHAPKIYTVASALYSTYPDLKDDVAYVLKRSLEQFEQAEQMEMKNIETDIENTGNSSYDSEDASREVGYEENYEAFMQSSLRAQARGDVADDGTHISIAGISHESRCLEYRPVARSPWTTYIDLTCQTVSKSWEQDVCLKWGAR